MRVNQPPDRTERSSKNHAADSTCVRLFTQVVQSTLGRINGCVVEKLFWAQIVWELEDDSWFVRSSPVPTHKRLLVVIFWPKSKAEQPDVDGTVTLLYL